jgi:hypothetical protein
MVFTVAAHWTHVLPTEEGFYWLRVPGEFAPEVVRVARIAGVLQALICGSREPVPLEGDSHEWCGPLVAPSL